MDCREAARFVQLRLDEEIEPLDCTQLDLHLERCPHCRRQVEAELTFQAQSRVALTQATSATTPAALRARILEQTERERAEGAFPFGRALAACMALFMVGALSWGATSTDARAVEESVTKHSRNLPPEVRAEVADDKGVGRFLNGNLRYNVRVPKFHKTKKMPVRLVGARLSSIRDKDAAYVIYDHRGARLSVFAYPGDEQVGESEGFEPRRVGKDTVYVGRRRGYNVVNWRDRDLNYSMVSDVDPGEMVRLVSYR